MVSGPDVEAGDGGRAARATVQPLEESRDPIFRLGGGVVDKRLLGEFMGTLVLILMGNGVVAGVLLKRSKAEGAGWIVITAGWAFAVMSGVFTAIAFGSNDGHLNPAVTLGAAVASGDFSRVLPYWLAQMSGAICGAVLVWAHYFPHWRETSEPAAKLACFS